MALILLQGFVAYADLARFHGSTEDITAQQAATLVKEGKAILIDVREKSELAFGVAEPAQWIPTSKISANHADWTQFLTTTSKDKKLIFYCAAGGRSGRASELAAKLGFNTANMGGFKDWKAAGLPVKKQQ